MSKNTIKQKIIITSIILISVLFSGENKQDLVRKGPYNKLVIANAMIIPGHGGPAYGPADIIIENDRIVQIISYNGLTGRGPKDKFPKGDRIIDATGMYVMPGLIDLHTHIRTPELPLNYIYNMKLAHGVTTMVNGSGRGWSEALKQQKLSNENKITAPRMFPIRDWGPSRSRDPGHMPTADKIEKWHDTNPQNISRLAKEYLESDFSFYKKSQIRQLNKKVKTLAKLEEKKDKKTFKKKSKVKTDKIKLRIAKKIETTKTELRKLQELYSAPERLPGVVRLQVAKKIEIKKNELKEFSSDPYSIFKSKKARNWAGLQIVKVFLGIPIVPGR